MSDVEMYKKVIELVFQNTNSYMDAMIAYLVMVYIDQILDIDPEDMTYIQYKTVSKEVTDMITRNGLYTQLDAERYIKDVLVELESV